MPWHRRPRRELDRSSLLVRRRLLRASGVGFRVGLLQPREGLEKGQSLVLVEWLQDLAVL